MSTTLSTTASLEKRLPKWASAYSVSLYSSLVLFVFVLYHFFSDGDFSILLTLAGVLRLFAFIMLLVHMLLDKTCAGVSAKTLSLFSMVCFSFPFFQIALIALFSTCSSSFLHIQDKLDYV